MTSASLFAITLALDPEGSRSDLLALASVLHRRGVDVLEAELARPTNGRRVFHATFKAKPAHANTVLRTFENLVDVLDAVLFEAFDARQPDGPSPSGPMAVRSAGSAARSHPPVRTPGTTFDPYVLQELQ